MAQNRTEMAQYIRYLKPLLFMSIESRVLGDSYGGRFPLGQAILTDRTILGLYALDGRTVSEIIRYQLYVLRDSRSTNMINLNDR